jgi:hypothetical protein
MRAAPSGLTSETRTGRCVVILGPGGHAERGGMPVALQELRIGRPAEDGSRTLSRFNDVPSGREPPTRSSRAARLSADGTIPIVTP